MLVYGDWGVSVSDNCRNIQGMKRFYQNLESCRKPHWHISGPWSGVESAWEILDLMLVPTSWVSG